MKKALALLVLLVVAPFAAFASAKGKEPPKKFDPTDDINKARPDARKIAFTTDEGTWMSVDLSPDGSTLVFDLLGDIYAMPVAGGAAHALTRGPAWDSHPRFSPDGKSIAFVSDRSGIENLWIMDADGKNPRAVTEEKNSYVRSGAWSPDGNYLVARKEDGKRAGIPPVELWLFHVRGGSGVKLTSSDELNNASGPVFSPDGRYMYFSVRERRFSYTPDLSRGLWQIVRYDRRTGDVAPLTTGFGGAVRPAVTPDGKTMLFVSRRDANSVLVARDLASGAERIIAGNVTRDEQEGFAQMDLWPNYAISRDGRTVFFTNAGKIHRLDIASGREENIPFTADVEQYLAPRVAWQEHLETGPLHARILRWATQSPDGQTIVFDAFGRIWIQRLAGGRAAGAPVRLTSDGSRLPRREYAPSISPDGQWIAFVTWSDAHGGQLWKVPFPGSAATGAPQQLTTVAGHYANPEWSPKGDRIVFVQGTGLELRGRQPEEESAFDIRWISAAGGESQFVTTVKVADTFRFHPQAWFSADGTRLFYRDFIEPAKPKDDPKNDLVSIRLDGTDKKRLLRFPAIGDLVPSPDEQWVAFTSRDNVYVAALPNLVLKEQPEVGTKEGAVPVWRLSEEAGGFVDWADGGKTITWTLGNQFHRLPLQAAFAFVEEEKRKAEAKKKEGDKSAKKNEAKKDDAKKDDAKEGDDETKLKVPKSESIAIDLAQPRPVPSGSYVLRNARIITMKGDEVLERADVVVTGNRIAAAGAAGTVTVPAGAVEIDAGGKTIIPGLIDTHAHLHYSGFEIFPETKWEYAANLAYGVTTVYDPSAPSLDVFGQAEMVDAGMMIGPRVYSSGDVLYGGQQTDIYAEVGSLEDAKRQVRRMKAYGARMIKVYQQPQRSQRIWFAEASRDEHMLLTAEGAGELQTDMTMALDGFTAFEHALPVELRKDVIQFLAKSGTFYTPTLLVAYGGPWGEQYFWQTRNAHDDAKLRRFVPHLLIDEKARRHVWIDPSEYFFPTVAVGVAAVRNAGGSISLGAHGQLQGLGPHWELWAMAGEGTTGAQKVLTPLQALQASTILSADKLGFAPDLGSIEAGKLADFIVLDANPLDDIHNSIKIHKVIKNGEIFDGATLAKEWPEKQPLPKFFWE
ncbi:MAG TPA: amidohydrolase family protein [Thermoanaerobaculia bacterium]|nr:amidohydrolase family protein [Thermoanaerobaculia bacterium]